MNAPSRFLEGVRGPLLRSVDEFVRREVVPLALEADEHPEGAHLLRILPGAGELGLLDALRSPERGGQGMDTLSFLLALVEVAAGSAAAAVLLLVHDLALLALEEAGLEEGAEGEAIPLHCLAVPAVFTGGVEGLRIRCDFVPGLPLAEKLVALGEDGRVALFDLPAQGMERGYLFDHGLRASRPAELQAGPARPSGEGRITREELERVEALLELGVAAVCAGIVCASLAASADYAGQRYQGGDLIGRHQQVRLMLGEMEASREAAFVLLEGAAGDEARVLPLTAARAVRPLLAERALRCACDAVQLHGGYGYMREQGMERLMRDASCLQAWPVPSRQALLGPLS